MKKILTILVMALLLSGPSQAWADEVEVDCVANPDDAACIEEWNYGVMPISETAPIDDQTEIIEDTEIMEEEPALWPMYLSLGALGTALLVFIVLNLFGGKKRK